MPTLTIRTEGRPEGGRLLFPAGMTTPHADAVSVEVKGPEPDRRTEAATGQSVLVADLPPATPYAIHYAFAAGSAYPAGFFTPHDSRFTRAADALIADARALADAPDPALAVARHVAALFTYGHPDTRYYDDLGELPQLCGLTEGSCVDINAYLIASLRAAGVKAGYVTGVFFPAEKTAPDGRAWAEDMHCWVVTRCAHGLREWDIAHHLKMGTREIAPALDPKPGRRLPLAWGMGLSVPGTGLADAKLIAEPMWLADAGAEEAANRITLAP
ncbi:MAG: transglutaminase domain-containing protein [Shimia sp.]